MKLALKRISWRMAKTIKTSQTKRKWLRLFSDFSVVALLLIGRGSFADHYFVPSGSMEPTIRASDRLLVNKLAYGLRIPLTKVWLTSSEPQRGDVVVFSSPVDGTVLVKRLVGLPGDRIAFKGGELTINGKRVSQFANPAVGRLEALPGQWHPLSSEEDQGPSMAEQVIPPGNYWMMGDHRGNSADSRYFGWVPRDNLLGRAVLVLYSSRDGLAPTERMWIPLHSLEPSRVDPRLFR